MTTPAQLQAIATREAAHAVLTELLNVGTVVKVSVVPSGNALGFVHFDTKQSLPTCAELENHITAVFARVCSDTIVGGPDSTSSSTLESVRHMAERLADMQVPDWRRTQPDLPATILKRCQARATELVKAHKDHIIKVAAVLAEKGTLTGEELAAL